MRISDWSSDVCSSDLDNQRVGVAHLRPDCGGQAIAHRAQTAAGQPFVRIVEMEMLGSPHLMLANFRRDDRVTALRRLVKRSNGPLRQDFLAALAKIRSEEHTSELQSLMRTSYAVFCLKKKNTSPPARVPI